jgi:hypothetical protein
MQRHVTFLCKQDKSDKQSWFMVKDGGLHANVDIAAEDIETVTRSMTELSQLLLARYSQRLPKAIVSTVESANNHLDNVVAISKDVTEEALQPLRFYPDLNIAFGHFKTATDDSSETLPTKHDFQ